MATTVGKLNVILGLDSKRFSKGTKNATSSIRRFTKSISSAIFKVGKYAAIMGGAAAAAVALFVRRQFGVIDSTAKMADVLGLTTEQLVGMTHVASLAGVAQGELEVGFRRLQKSIADGRAGLSTATRSFDKLGLSADALNKMSPDEQIKAVADAFPNLTSQADRAAVAQDIFGRSGLKMIKILEQGGDAIARQQEEARALGLTFTRFEASQIEKANDAITRLGSAFTGVFRTIAIKVAPAVTKFATFFVDKWITVRGSVLSTVSGMVNGIAERVRSVVSFTAPIVIGYAKIWYSVMSAIVGAVRDGFNIIGSAFSMLTGWLGNSGATLLDFRSTAIAALAAIEYGFIQWQNVVELATVKVMGAAVRLGSEIKHLFTVAIPAYLQWLGRNWQNILITIGANTLTFFENLSSNVVNVITSIPDMIAGRVSFGDVWKPLGEGFVNVIEKLPEVAGREIGELERMLAGEADRLGEKVGGGFAEHIRKRLSEAELQTAGGNDFIDKLVGLFDPKNMGDMPALSLDEDSKNAIENFGTGKASFKQVALSRFSAGMSQNKQPRAEQVDETNRILKTISQNTLTARAG